MKRSREREGAPRTGKLRAAKWPAPQPIEEPALPHFPSQALPRWLRDWVEAQSTALQVPAELPALLSLAVISTASAKRFEVHVRRGWIEPLNVYVLVALASGTRKSVVFEAATAPLVTFEIEAAQRSSAISAEVRSEGLLRLVVDSDRAERSRRRRARSAPAAKATVEGQRFVSDATPERVASLLAEGGGRLAVLSDEGEICSIIAGRYGGSFEIFLKAHSGQVLTVERQGRPRVRVRRPALTLGLAVQPDVLDMLAAKKTVRERGLLARFLVAVPRSNVGYRAIASPPVPETIVARYAEGVRALLEHEDAVDEHGELKPAALSFSESAHELFMAFEAEIEEMLRADGVLGAIPSWGAKLAGCVARIAGNLWLAEHPKGEPSVVDAATLRSAIAIGRYAIPHALAAFSQAGADRRVAGAQAIVGWLKKVRRGEIARREIHQALRSRFPTPDSLLESLALLEERGYVRSIEPTKGPGRPSVRFAVHPGLARSVKAVRRSQSRCF